MSGQTNLIEVLKSLNVTCDNVEYGFSNVEHAQVKLEEVLGIFRESEGLTVIATKDYFSKYNLKYEGPYAKLTIEVHTSLELVGLTAVLAKKLAEHKISANVIAGYFHDHIFVQYNLRQDAIDALNNINTRSSYNVLE